MVSVLICMAGIMGRIWAEKRHPGLLIERNEALMAGGIKPWDKLLAPLMALSISFPLLIVAGLDHRSSWSPVFPIWLNIVGLFLIAGGYFIVVWAMAENRFFSSVARIQTDRRHVVCDSGPYQFVRHPGYAGNILPLPGIVLALGSIWAVIPAIFTTMIILIRTILEDDMLKKELPGYQDYAQRVPDRLFPGIF
jgi:protein-S-isoprenylcysteine O-methyltransferase Ste14